MKRILILLCAATAFAERKPDSPLEKLPAHVQQLTYFGERADFSPDNGQVAFMAKSFGDAFTIDLKTRAIRCLTCSLPGAAFLRVMHLANGDYLLIGAEKFTDIRTSRGPDNELWLLRKGPGARPVKLGLKMSEGAAVSKQSMKIAVAIHRAQDPAIPQGHSRIILAEVKGGRLENRQTVFESTSDACRLEAQDFFDSDNQLTYTCYEPKGMASVWSIDLRTKQTTNHSQRPGTYNEVEGIFPDGKHTLVEADRQRELHGTPGGFREIDIWKLRMDGTGKSFERLTYFNDHEGWKASNPVVSTDGKWMAFQVARSADEAGVGYGILLYRLER
jgi:hypothetical protein